MVCFKKCALPSGEVWLRPCYSLCHSESFHPFASLSLWQTNKMVRNYKKSANKLQRLLLNMSHKMTKWMINSVLAVKISNVIAVQVATDWNHKPQAMVISSLDSYVFLSWYLPLQMAIKLLSSVCGIRSFSPCTNSSHKLRDMHHFT